jgi:hypothetical protein
LLFHDKYLSLRFLPFGLAKFASISANCERRHVMLYAVSAKLILDRAPEFHTRLTDGRLVYGLPHQCPPPRKFSKHAP